MDTIEDALRSYRCAVKVKLLLPCNHEPEMLCADEEEIQRGEHPMPECREISHTPRRASEFGLRELCFPRYVYPSCKHKREVKCFELAEYKRCPNKVGRPFFLHLVQMKVPLCEHIVEFLPDCGHSMSVKCSLKSAYQASPERFVCPQKLQVELPRCGHRAKVSCLEERTLRGWQGGAQASFTYSLLEVVALRKTLFEKGKTMGRWMLGRHGV